MYAEALKDYVPVGKLRPQDLAFYGYVKLNSSLNITYTPKTEKDDEVKTSMSFEIGGITSDMKRIIVHVFDREYNKEMFYYSDYIDFVFDILLGDTIQVRSIPKVDSFTNAKVENGKLLFTVYGTFDLKLKLTDEEKENVLDIILKQLI